MGKFEEMFEPLADSVVPVIEVIWEWTKKHWIMALIAIIGMLYIGISSGRG